MLSAVPLSVMLAWCPVVAMPQRLKLRKLLQDYSTPAPAPAPAPVLRTPAPLPPPQPVAVQQPVIATPAAPQPPPVPRTAEKSTAAAVDSISEGKGSAAGRSSARKKPAPIYEWEKRALRKEKEAALQQNQASREEFSDDSDIEPVGMADAVMEFQVRMTEAEYKQLIVRRRRKAAEDKFFSRANKVVEASKQRAVEIATERGASGIAVTGPYVEPAMLETHLHRTPQPKKWISEKGFE